jgi:WXG100 family type VII secretion target
MNAIVADFSGLVSIEQAIGRAVDELENDLAGLRARIAPLCEALWTGAAAEAYHRTQQEWDAAAEELRDAMNGLHRIVRTSRGNYSKALQANLKMWKRR